MANIMRRLIEAERRTDETIEAIVVGKHYDDDRPHQSQRDVVLDRETGLALLDVEYDNGFGGADCYPMYAWTATRVYMIHEYDGATHLTFVPRHPIACEPSF